MSGPQPPYRYYPQQPQPGPPSRRHRGNRRILTGFLAAAGAILVIAIVAAAVSKKTPAPAGAASAPAATTAPASSAPAAVPAAAKSRVLIRFSGSGIKNSAPFPVGQGSLTVTYHFDCSSFGQAGNFGADLLYGDQSSLNSDDQSIANDLALHGGQTTTVYPQDPGQMYHISVDSECSWRIVVRS